MLQGYLSKIVFINQFVGIESVLVIGIIYYLLYTTSFIQDFSY